MMMALEHRTSALVPDGCQELDSGADLGADSLAMSPPQACACNVVTKQMGTLLPVNVPNVRASDTSVWNQREVARICDYEASSHRKDIEHISNEAAEWPDRISMWHKRCISNSSHSVCLSEDERRKMHGSQWHA